MSASQYSKIKQAVILAGGFGTRISEETHLKPKPMVEIGARPILWHIMKIYSHYGINEFIVCLGYKGYVIKEYFSNYFLHSSDVTFNLAENKTIIHQHTAEPWTITLVDTGIDTNTGGRMKKIIPYIKSDHFCMTYGDGVSDVDINHLIQFHFQHKKLATVTAVKPPSRFGAMELKDERVVNFEEKPVTNTTWINGGFFVLAKTVLNDIAGDAAVWETDVLKRLSIAGQLSAYRHQGFWAPMDTLRDKNQLESLWQKNSAPWKIWQ